LQLNFNLVVLIFNYNLEIKLCVKTRLVTKTCKKRDVPSKHDVYTSWCVSNISLKMISRESKHVAV